MSFMPSTSSRGHTNDSFDDFTNQDCFRGQVPNPLDVLETASPDNLLQQHKHQQSQPHFSGTSPAPTLITSGASSIAMQPHPDLTLEFSESHFLSVEWKDLPRWKNPFDLFDFRLATPYASPTPEALPPRAPPPTVHTAHKLTPAIITPPSPPLPQDRTPNPARRKPLPASPLTATLVQQPKTLIQHITTTTNILNAASAAVTIAALRALATPQRKTAAVTRSQSIADVA